MGRFGALGIIMLWLTSACQAADERSPGAEAATVSCEPLRTESVSVSLGDVLAAGRAADGTLYVIDGLDGATPRLFVATGEDLVWLHESGTGETTTTDGTLLSFSFYDREPPLHVELWRGDDGAERMGVLEGELPAGKKQFEIGSVGEELEPVDAAEVASLAARDERVDMVAEYAAQVSGDRLLVVLRPQDFESYDEFRVFFGPAEKLSERVVDNVSRARDGGSTYIEFMVDGEVALASFPMEFENETFVRGEPSLTVDDDELSIELMAEGTAPAGAAYYCLE